MKTVIPILLSSLLAVYLVGCASTGSNFDESRVTQIKKGETTEAELVKWFGQPQNRTTSSEGQTMLVWMYAQANVKGTSLIPVAGVFIGGMDSKSKTLQVTLQNGIVQSYSSSGGGMACRQMHQGVSDK